jgi:hypothetical protein
VFFSLGVNGSGTTFIVHSVKELAGNHAVQATGANRPNYGIEPQGGRRNLLVRTEEFDNAAWLKSDATITVNTTASPVGTLTADTVTANAGLSFHYAYVASAPTVTGAYTYSVYVKKGTATWLFLTVTNSSINYFNLDTGLFGTAPDSPTVTPLADGWFRITVTRTLSAQNLHCGIGVAGGNGLANFTATGTETLIVWGAQAELGSTATNYQRVTDQYNVTEAGVPPVSYLFFNGNNFAMSTPSINFPAGPTNPTLGPDLVTNGDFSGGSTGWTTGAGWSISGGSASGSPATASLFSTDSIGAVAGKTYRVTFTVTAYTSGTVRSNIGAAVNGAVRSATGTYTEFITSIGGDGRIYFVVSNFVGSIDNISVREIDAAQAPDKMTVFAGVRKLSDASVQSFVELSAAGDSNNGAFYLRAPESAAKYSFLSRGTGNANAIYSGGLYSAPTTNVLTGIGNISGDVSTLRADGTQAATSTADQGTGTYGNYPLFIGGRNSASLFFSGHLYSLIVRGSQSNTGQISSTETWVAGKTGVVI